jgi:hypothetical protein
MTTFLLSVRRAALIQDIPSPQDFFDSGLELFDFAWETVSDLLTTLSEAEEYQIDTDEVSEEYWAAAKRRLTTALAVTQQGVEFILKGKVAEVSPYLLLADSPDRWPSPYDNKPIMFSQFKTVDAQDLPRLHDIVQATPLPADFIKDFNAVRAKRNTISHSIDKNLQVHTSEVIETILFFHSVLFPHANWIKSRMKFIENAPVAKLHGGDFSTNQICREFAAVLGILQPSAVQKYFGIDKKQRRYLCPKCFYNANRDGGFEEPLAVLRPKGPDSTSIYCLICDEVTPVLREDCARDGCLGNVLSADERLCLTCGR